MPVARRHDVTLSSVPARRARRDELLEIAARLFAERGFARVTMDHIGAAAGVSGAALYHHFPSKEALLGEMLVSISEHLLDQARAIVAREDVPEHALTALIAAHAEFAVSRPELITVHLQDLVHASAEDRRSVRRLQRRYVEMWIQEVLKIIPDVDPRVIRAGVHAAFGVLNSTAFGRPLGSARLALTLRTLTAQVLDAPALRSLSSRGIRP